MNIALNYELYALHILLKIIIDSKGFMKGLDFCRGWKLHLLKLQL